MLVFVAAVDFHVIERERAIYAGTVYSSSFFVVRESSTKIANRSEFVSSLVGPSRWIRVCLCVRSLSLPKFSLVCCRLAIRENN